MLFLTTVASVALVLTRKTCGREADLSLITEKLKSNISLNEKQFISHLFCFSVNYRSILSATETVYQHITQPIKYQLHKNLNINFLAQK